MKPGFLNRALQIQFLLVLGAATVMPTLAQKNGFQFTSPATLSVGRDSKFLTGKQELEDTVLLLTAPTLALLKTTPRAELVLSYEPEFEMFAEHRELQAWNHAAELRFDYRMSRRSSLRAGGSLTVTQDPARRLAGSLFILPRSNYRATTAYLHFGHRVNRRTSIDLRLDNTTTKIVLPEIVTPGLFDQMGTGATLTLSQILAERHTLNTSYSLLKPTLLSRVPDSSMQPDSLLRPVHNISLAYGYSTPEGLSTQLSAGVTRSSRTSYVLSGQLEKRTPTVHLTLGYSRHVSFFGTFSSPSQHPDLVVSAQGFLPSSLFQAADLRLRGNVSSRLDLELRARASRTSSEAVERNIEALWGSLHFGYRLTDRLLAFLQAELYGQRFNELLGAPLSRQRYFGGIRVLLGETVHGERARPQSEAVRTERIGREP